jgi:hypothetical protein
MMGRVEILGRCPFYAKNIKLWSSRVTINSINYLSARPLAKEMLVNQTLKVKITADFFKPLPSSKPNQTIPPIINPPYPSQEKPIINKPPVIINPSSNTPPPR